jgi:hypothetical protein
MGKLVNLHMTLKFLITKQTEITGVYTHYFAVGSPFIIRL